MLSQEEVRRLFDYDPETGDLTWRVSLANRAPVGAKAGTNSGHGYLKVSAKGRKYYVHRVIWLWVYGYFPEHDIDHINRDRADNRLENLRESSRSCNIRNANSLRNNTSGVKGVYWDKTHSKWQAKIMGNRHLGYHTDFTEAVLHRLAAEQCLDWEGCDSSSDSYKYLNSIRGESK